MNIHSKLFKSCTFVVGFIGCINLCWSDAYSETWSDHTFSSMSNIELHSAAAAFHNTEMNATHQALNYQWMAQHANESGAKRSNATLKNLLKNGFKGLWKKNNSLKLGNNAKTNNKDLKLDYGLKVSSGKLKLAVEHRF